MAIESLIVVILLVVVLFLLVWLLKSNSKLSKELKEIEKLEESRRGEREELLQHFTLHFDNLSTIQKERLETLIDGQREMVKSTNKKLNYIRATVEEKLEKTLSRRLGQSFETVGKQLIEVQKGLGEMQTLAQDVGGLKRVLSNVKMRGGIGEVQLEMILESILAPNQYSANVKPDPNREVVVEFAIKLPGKEGKSHIWLPVDAKFPKEHYRNLQEAYDSGESRAIEREQKKLESAIKKMASDISQNYITPPYTTDFAILFLPFEGIYAEVIRRAELIEELHKRYKVLVTGPTTFAAILNSLQMGFRTLVIEKRSGEVWRTLAEVKREFETFGTLLTKAQKNIQGGLNEIDQLVGTRTRAIQRKLKEVESDTLPSS